MNTIGWGQAVENNINWGATNTINFGYIYDYSASGETSLKKKLNY